MAEHVIGIDLGTTYSCVAVVRDGQPVVIPNKGHLTTPSIVAITTSGKRVVGHPARRQAITNAEHTVFALKRLTGRKWKSAEVKTTSLTAAYSLVEGPHDDVRVEMRGQTFSLPEVGAMILTELRLAAEEFLGSPVAKAVVTVPAYFNDNQRQATKDAGAIAGLEVLRIINEPTAAAIAYGVGRSGDKTIAVYDLGGGTFDISIVNVGESGKFEVLSTAGDTYLGGEDFDVRLMDWMIDDFSATHGVDLRDDRTALQRLKDTAEQLKCHLSGSPEGPINLPFLATKDGQPLHLEKTVTRDLFDQLTKDLVDRTIEVCQEATTAAGLGPKDLDDVVLVGGSSRIASVQAAVRSFFGRDPSKGVHPDEAVAVGAALHGYSLAHGGEAAPAEKRVKLEDVTPLSLGIVTAGQKFEPIISRNTRVPTSQSRRFMTARDDQPRLDFFVMQGESVDPQENELLGRFTLANLRKGPGGSVKIDVHFALDEDGIVQVTARDVDTGHAQSVAITAKSTLSADEIQSMMDAASDYMAQTKKADDVGSAEQELTAVCATFEAALEDAMGTLSATSEGQELIGAALGGLAEARTALEKHDAAAARAQVEQLKALSKKMQALAS